MHHRSIVGGLALLIAGMVVVSGCGDNDNSIILGSCGNDVVDGNNEDCDRTDLDGATCQSLGLTGGTLSCTSGCKFNTSACTGSTNRTPTPVATATPPPGATQTPVSATATPTTAGPNPTVTPTPGSGPTCTGSESIAVEVGIASNYTGAVVDLAYPASANIPGTGQDQSVKDRIVIAPQGGLSVKNDSDKQGEDGVDDTVTASFVGSEVNNAGVFVTATFDCVAGQSEPSAGDFHCTVVSASLSGESIQPPPNCTVTIK